MDPLTQGLLGASLAGCAAQKERMRVALLCGVVGGMAPDLDILIRSNEDPLLFLEYHRHFTHALAFIPLGGLIVSALLYLLLYRKLHFGWIYLFTTLGYATHGLLDASTSYGTRLYWPFSDERVGWNIISIIDPIFTITLCVGVAVAAIWRRVAAVRIAVFLALCYLLSGMLTYQKVSTYIHRIAAQRGHPIERLLLNPTIGNQILWRSVYQSGDSYYIDAVHYPFWGTVQLIEGMKVAVIDPKTVFPELGGHSSQRRDIARFNYFSQGYLYHYPYEKDVLADLRYGVLPQGDRALWGIKVFPTEPNKPVAFKNLRKFNPRDRQVLWDMIQGNLDIGENEQ